MTVRSLKLNGSFESFALIHNLHFITIPSNTIILNIKTPTGILFPKTKQKLMYALFSGPER